MLYWLTHYLANLYPARTQSLQKVLTLSRTWFTELLTRKWPLLEIILGKSLKSILLNGWPGSHKQCLTLLLDFFNFRDKLVVIGGTVLKDHGVVIPAKAWWNLCQQSSRYGKKCFLRAREILFRPKSQGCLNCSLCVYWQTNNNPKEELSHKTFWQTVTRFCYRHFRLRRPGICTFYRLLGQRFFRNMETEYCLVTYCHHQTKKLHEQTWYPLENCKRYWSSLCIAYVWTILSK